MGALTISSATCRSASLGGAEFRRAGGASDRMSSQIGTAVKASAIAISAKRSQGVPRIELYCRITSTSGVSSMATINLRTEKPRPSARNWLPRREMQVLCIRNDRPRRKSLPRIARLTSAIFCCGIAWAVARKGLFPEAPDDCPCQHTKASVHHVLPGARPSLEWH